MAGIGVVECVGGQCGSGQSERVHQRRGSVLTGQDTKLVAGAEGVGKMGGVGVAEEGLAVGG